MGNRGDGGTGNARDIALKNQTLVDNKAMGVVDQVNNQNSQFYSQPLAGLAQGFSSSVGAISPQLAQQYMQLMSSGGNMSGATGVDQNALGRQLTGYASNPGATNLSGVNPQLQSFFGGQMQNGIDPRFAQNAQSQIAQAGAQQLSDATGKMAPGQNRNAIERDIQNKQIVAQTNLAGDLAGKSQDFAQQGAGGLQQQAAGLDQQKLTMLMQALQSGQGLNTQTLENLLNGIQSGQQGMAAATGFAGQGQTGTLGTLGYLGNASQLQGQQAQGFAQQANAARQNNGLGGLIGTVGGMFSPIKIGGAAGLSHLIGPK